MIVHRDIPEEARRQSVQAAIDATKSTAERNRLGQFATPNALALDISRYLASIVPNDMPLRFADPSIGSGSFFSAVLAVFGANRIESAVGVELDSDFAQAARELWSDSGLEVASGDFTRPMGERTLRTANLVLANPPYVRHHHIERVEKERLKSLTHTVTGLRVSGLAGLYVYFLLLATAWMEDDGYAAWLIPSEFMDVNYGSTLKQFLTDRVTLLRVHRFDPADVQFGDALVSSAVVIFKKLPPAPEHKPEFTYGGTVTQPRTSHCIAPAQLRKSRKWTVYPSNVQNDRHIRDDDQGPTLGNFFRIQRGIATGGNKFFILDRVDAKRLEIPSDCLRPMLPAPRHLAGTMIDAGDDGYPLLDRQLAVIDCDLPEHLVQERHPRLWEYLQSAEAAGVRGGYLVSKRTPWYRQEQREPAPFLCTYMGRGSDDKQPFRFIHNRSRAICTNLYLMLYPINGLATMLRKFPERSAEVHEMLSRITAYELRGEGRVYGGGLNKIEPSELGRVCATSFVERWPDLARNAVHMETLSLFGE